MKELVSKLLSNNVVEARNLLDAKIVGLVNEKLSQIKLRLAAEMFEEVGVDVCFEDLDEAYSSGSYNQSNVGSGKQRNKSTTTRSNIQKVGRAKIIKFRVRKGKIQRRKKFSAVKGYTIRGGKLTRMMPAERRHRHIASIRSKFKKRAKLSISNRKRRISIRKRRSVGL